MTYIVAQYSPVQRADTTGLMGILEDKSCRHVNYMRVELDIAAAMDGNVDWTQSCQLSPAH